MLNHLADDENGLQLTRSYPGCISVECRHSMDDQETIYIWAKWKTEAAFNAYMKMRAESNFFGPWVKKMSAEPTFIRLSEKSY